MIEVQGMSYVLCICLVINKCVVKVMPPGPSGVAHYCTMLAKTG